MLWMYCIVRPITGQKVFKTSSRARRDAIAICINCLAVWGSGKRRHIADRHPLMVCVRVLNLKLLWVACLLALCMHLAVHTLP